MGGLVRWGVGALEMLDDAWVRRSLGGHMCEHCEGRNFLGWLGDYQRLSVSSRHQAAFTSITISST